MALSNWGAILGNVFLFFLVLGLASTVEYDAFARSLRSRGLLVGVVAQFFFLPFIGCIVAKTMFEDRAEVGISLIITASSPGGSYSNWWTSIFNGDLSLSVAMTTVSSLLSVGFLPLNLYMYVKWAYPHGTSINVEWAGLFVSIGVVIGAICAGLTLGTRWPKLRRLLSLIGNVFGVLLVLLGFFFSSNSSSPIWSRGWKFYLGLTVPCVAGMVLSLVWARQMRLEKPQALTVAIEVVYQNTAIALAIILSSFEQDVSCVNQGRRNCDIVGSAAGVPTFYQVVQVVSLGVLCVVCLQTGWTYAPKGTPLLRAITTDFQPSSIVQNHHDNLASESDLEIARDGRQHELGEVGRDPTPG